MIGGGKGKFMIKWILFLMENFYTYHRHRDTHTTSLTFMGTTISREIKKKGWGGNEIQ